MCGGGRPLGEMFSNLFELVGYKEAWVANYLEWTNDALCWNVVFGRNFRIGN